MGGHLNPNTGESQYCLWGGVVLLENGRRGEKLKKRGKGSGPDYPTLHLPRRASSGKEVGVRRI